MPVVGCNRDELFRKLGREYTEEEFDELCFEYGIELDDVTTEKEFAGNQGVELEDGSEDVIYRIDIPANRYDLLCVEGIARALNVFKGRCPPPKYSLSSPGASQMQRMTVKPETALVRPFVVCATLRGVTFDKERYASFIDLQDKLHQNLCRQRSLVAIGTHDLDTIKGPFSYEALPPEEIKFVPLKQTEEFEAGKLLDHYLATDSSKLGKFVPLIKDSIVYPVIYDADRTVLSLPPIINGAHSAISLDTKNVFIECTATDLTKAKIVLNTVVCMFSEYCSTPFEVEPVEVEDAFGATTAYPDLSSREMEVSTSYVNTLVGIDLPPTEVSGLLNRMQLDSTLSADGTTAKILIPPTRSDVLHPCDVAEDVAIAYGYNNVKAAPPPTVTVGKELHINALTELLRAECAMAGFTEVLTWALCSRAENFDKLRLEDGPEAAVSVGNPATAEFELCRTSLLPAAFKTLGANKDAALPLCLFEISDVVLPDASRETGARNERRLMAVHTGKTSGFELVHGLLNRLMEVCGVPLAGTPAAEGHKFGEGYKWEAADMPTFFPGRGARILANGKDVGRFGVVHPEVLGAFKIENPVAALEINLEPFCFNQDYVPLM